MHVPTVLGALAAVHMTTAHQTFSTTLHTPYIDIFPPLTATTRDPPTHLGCDRGIPTTTVTKIATLPTSTFSGSWDPKAPCPEATRACRAGEPAKRVDTGAPYSYAKGGVEPPPYYCTQVIKAFEHPPSAWFCPTCAVAGATTETTTTSTETTAAPTQTTTPFWGPRPGKPSATGSVTIW